MEVSDDVVDILAGFSLLADLSTPELDSLVETFGEETFQDGDRVLTAADHVSGAAEPSR